MNWEYESLQGGGERWRLIDDGPIRNVLCTVVRLPGTLYRTYFLGGEFVDTSTAYLAHCEIRRMFHNDEIPRLPGFSDRAWTGTVPTS